jgi:hypothetical protein
MLRTGGMIKFFAPLLILGLLIQPVQAAPWDGGHSGYRHYPSFGRTSFWLPAAALTLVLAGLTYYYCDGVYYHKTAHKYLVIAPPVGAVVTILPDVYQPMTINGITYYTYDDIYYQAVPEGYIVVTPPSPGAVPAPPAGSAVVIPPNAGTVNTPAQGKREFFTVNIPNDSGGYTPVVINRHGKGFVGPQGEYYPKFPSVKQLQVMYGG